MSADVMSAPADAPLLDTPPKEDASYADLEPAAPLPFDSIYAALNAPSAPPAAAAPAPTKYFEKSESEKQADLESGKFRPIAVDDEGPPVDEDTLRDIDDVERKIAPREPPALIRTFKRLASRFHIRPRRKYIEIRNREDAEAFYYRRNVGTEIPVFNPQARVDKNSPIGRLLAYSQPVSYLRAEGLFRLDAAQLADLNLSIVDFRNYRRSAQDLHALWPSLEDLKNAGFKACNFDARLWSMEQICTAYNAQPIDVCRTFDCSLRDAIAAGVPNAYLPLLGFSSEHIFADPNCFELLVALRMTPVELREHFNLDPQQLANADTGMQRIHFAALTVLCGWYPSHLRSIGMAEESVRACMTDAREVVKNRMLGALRKAMSEY